ncbi:MAG: hypothetical protein K6F77_08725 [Lachnospiraceae bacterium]|nr:hypothetical protein [Lachnospiraceae bacterium]
MLDGIMDTIQSWFQTVLDYTIYGAFYLIEVIILKFVSLIEETLLIFTGEQEVTYNDTTDTLINIFFEHRAIRGIYGGIALIGIVFAFGFAVWGVIKKALDLRGKQQGVTLGSIVGNLIKSILLIFGMNAIMMAALYTTNTLVHQASMAVQNGERLSLGSDTITFTDEQYAAMGRIINTIGNYSLNPSYRSRYNLNACYNDLRGDLEFLGSQGVFEFHYETEDGTVTWQSMMEELGTAYDYSKESAIDSYDDGLTNAILDCMEIFKSNTNIKVLKSYTRKDYVSETEFVPIDKILFLSGTVGTIGDNAAARNDVYNRNPSFTDNARLPFFTGEKSIYDYEEVRETFSPNPMYMNYFLVYVLGLAMLREMIFMIITCAVRIFNLVALYVAAPLAISSMPLDDGGKFKQWSTAFVVQLLSIVGMVISMRLFLLFVPIIWSSSLSISDNFLLDCVIKGVLTYGGLEAVNKVNSIFTGILADNAGYQAITASNMRDDMQRTALGRGLSAISGGALALAVAGKGLGAAGGQVKKGWNLARGRMADGRDPAKEQREERTRQRQMNSLKSDIDYAKQTGTHMDGTRLKGGELAKMESTYKHMEGGMGRREATLRANEDYRQDKLDRDSGIEGTKMLYDRPLPPPPPNNAGGGAPGAGGGAPAGGVRRQPPPGVGRARNVNNANDIQGQQNLNNNV